MRQQIQQVFKIQSQNVRWGENLQNIFMHTFIDVTEIKVIET